LGRTSTALHQPALTDDGLQSCLDAVVVHPVLVWGRDLHFTHNNFVGQKQLWHMGSGTGGGQRHVHCRERYLNGPATRMSSIHKRAHTNQLKEHTGKARFRVGDWVIGHVHPVMSTTCWLEHPALHTAQLPRWKPLGCQTAACSEWCSGAP
jgi:hypothetical protein